MKLKNVSTAIVATALFFAAGNSMSQGRGAEITLVPLDGLIVYNPCTFEEMMYSGSYQVVTRIEDDANGGFHGFINASGHTLAATGLTTGQGYKIVGSDPRQKLIITGSGTETYSSARRFAIVSQSGDANWFVTILFRSVINANGVQTVENISSFIECR